MNSQLQAFRRYHEQQNATFGAVVFQQIEDDEQEWAAKESELAMLRHNLDYVPRADIVKLGQQISVTVLEVDMKKRQIKLSMKGEKKQNPQPYQNKKKIKKPENIQKIEPNKSLASQLKLGS